MRLPATTLIVLSFTSLLVPQSSTAQSEIEPLAPRFWRTHDQPANDPAEIPLWPEGVPQERDVTQHIEDRADDRRNRWLTGVRAPTISVHQADAATRSGSAVVVCPGGGYAGLAWDKEGHDTARWLNSLGITGVVLKYRLSDYGQPAPGEDAQRAIATVRRHAAEWNIAPDRIGILGYSAGGHVASTAGTRFKELEIDGQRVSSRPDFMILVYPVISMDASLTHGGSRENLLGKNPTDELVREYSNDLQVTSETPPTFLVHCADDRAVPVENSLRMMRALENAKVPVELALFEQGGHGFGLMAEAVPAADWPRRCEAWLRERGLLSK